MIGKKYIYTRLVDRCLIYDTNNNYLGMVVIDSTNAWTPYYSVGVKYLPINSALKVLGYKQNEGVEIE